MVQRTGNEPLSPPDIYDPNDGNGYASVVRDGSLGWHAYAIDWSPNIGGAVPFNRGNFAQFIDAVRFDNGALDITYPGTARLTGPPWGAIYIYIGGSSPSHVRKSKDFSEFSKLRLEMRGAQDGEKILLNLKDRDDPDDGTQTNIPVTLSDEWRTYDFELASFDNADLTKLYVVTGFLFLDQQDPVSFSVRNITYLGQSDR